MNRNLKIHIFLGSLTVLLLAITMSRSGNRPFFDNVVTEAEAIFQAGELPPRQTLPPELLSLNYDQYRDIRWRKEFALFKKEGLPFQVELFHPGATFERPIEIWKMSGTMRTRLPYDSRFFDYGKNQHLNPSSYSREMGYAGVRLHYPLNKEEYLDELAVFQGASYFRVLGRGQIYGLSARGLAINTGMPNVREEFPVFTKFYLQEPTRNSDEFTIYALMESRSVTGAYQFHIIPGTTTRVYVKARLFFLESVESLGIAPLTSMFWFGENTREKPGDFRPEVHDSDGLLIHDAYDNNWTWRPLDNQKFQQDNYYVIKKLAGFGLVQRDRDYGHYEDLEAKYHLRPSAWVEPLDGFGEGSVRLMQLPTDDEFMDNVVAHWMPRTQPIKGDQINLEYVISWYLQDEQLPPLGRCTDTRVDYHNAPDSIRYVLDFDGKDLQQLDAKQLPTMAIATDPPNLIRNENIVKNEYEGSWRVSFELVAPAEGRAVDVACSLHREGKVLSETWRYTWIP